MTEARDTSSPARPAEVVVTMEMSVGSAAWNEHRSSVQIRLDEPLGSALPRVCRQELDRAARALGSPSIEKSVHEARKAIKRVRALLRLCRDEIGLRVYRVENVVLRDAARRIAPIREAAVMVETLEALTDRYGISLASNALGRLREDLMRKREKAWQATRAGLEDVEAIVAGAQARYGSFATGSRQPLIRDDFAAIRPGLHRTYRRGRKAMKQAGKHGTTAAYHEWRKRAKYLRYQLETLTPIWPEALSPLAGAFDDLGELLGTEHDLAILAEAAQADQLSSALLFALCSHERTLIHARAAHLGDRLYGEEPGRFVSRLQSYWEAWRPV